jgi:hypothetical protein
LLCSRISWAMRVRARSIATSSIITDFIVVSATALALAQKKNLLTHGKEAHDTIDKRGKFATCVSF